MCSRRPRSLERLYGTLDTKFFGLQSCRNPRGTTLPKCDPPYVRTIQAKLPRDSAVHPELQTDSVLGWIDHCAWKGPGVAVLFKYESSEVNCQAFSEKNLMKSKAEELPARIRRVRTQHLKISQAQLSKHVGAAPSHVSKWENGLLRPTAQHLMKLAVLLGGTEDALYFLEVAGVPSTYLANEREYKNAVDAIEIGNVLDIKPESIVSVPLLRYGVSSVAEAVQRGEVESYLPFLRKLIPLGASLIVIRIVGDSMIPLICDGYMVVIDITQRDPAKLVGRLVAIRDAAGITIRWLRSDKGVYFLVPESASSHYPVAVWSETDQQTTIEGAVLQWTGYPPEAKKG